MSASLNNEITRAPTSQVWRRILWSFANLGSSLGLRFGSNVILTHLLDPRVFGIMVIVNAMRFGIEMLTDVGIEQNIVRHREGLSERFFNTAWTMQIIRGAGLSAIFTLLSPLLARFYHIDVAIFLAVALAPFLNGLHSTSVFALVRTLDVKQRTVFEFKAEAIGFLVTITLAIVTPSVWALVIGMLVAVSVRSLLSYRLPHPPHRLLIDRGYSAEIVRFGRWIMITSIVMFAATNLDRLVLGRIAPLALLGIYGLARTIADIPPNMARKLSYQIIFPMVSASEDVADASFVRTRLKLVLGVSLILGVGVGCADWAVRILYDERYSQAGWMLALLLCGSLISVLANFNEGMLMGSGRPAYESAANIVRLVVLSLGLWLGYTTAGIPGAVLATILSEIGRYVIVAIGQQRAGMTMLGQDLFGVVVAAAMCAAVIAARTALSLGTPWSALP